jgi:release factor glutamine methyltransferase
MTPPARTGADALRQAIATLRAAGVEDAPRDARLLLARALDLAPDRLTLHLPDPLPPQAEAALAPLVAARAARQPMAQILGQRLFFGHVFEVTPDTLDPRPDTERLVEEAISRPVHHMLDLGTGTGCILISCLLAMPMATGLGTDQSGAALQVAVRNAARHNLSSRARFTQGDWFKSVTGRFDLIVSNPPYIAADEMPALAPEVRDWEPRAALTPEGDGLAAYRAIAAGAGARLLAGGRLLLEIGPTQGAAVTALLAAQGLAAIRILADLDGRDRVVTAEKPGGDSDCAAT